MSIQSSKIYYLKCPVRNKKSYKTGKMYDPYTRNQQATQTAYERNHILDLIEKKKLKNNHDKYVHRTKGNQDYIKGGMNAMLCEIETANKEIQSIKNN